MKETAVAFSSVDLIYYGDTLSETLPLEQRSVIASALEYLLSKQCDALVLGPSIPVFMITESKQWKREKQPILITPELLQSYLESMIAESRSTKDKGERIIHLTHHSEALDVEIASILGGHFIAS